jgi:hypothetical protein
VLPEQFKQKTLVESIALEYAWVLSRLSP